MFKPLLKTIPSLSGNMKIVCPLEGYKKKTNSSNEFDCVVNSAYLNTISNTLYDKNIKLNLRNGSYEYDVSRFYKYYSDIFYKNCFNYSQINIPILDETSVIYQSNTDFQFGCKRVSYIKSNNIFAFFAPIYIEGIDDIRNKVFKIKCEFLYETNRITKYLNIPISKIFDNNNNEIKNYLGDYLERYSEKINDNVVYFSKSYKNIYYGIDLNNGGFVDIEDNISKNLFNKYYTINDFDCIINKGFYRNSLLMKQILALSFYFDPENLLNENEKKFYKNTKVYISARWFNGDEPVDFYNFSDNYHKYSENIYKLDFNGSFRLSNTINNIMDVKYPGFNEASSTNYKYINTVAKNYNRWKLKYSSDEFPYIINNNYAFSFNQNSLYMYKEFPLRYNPLTAICKLKEGSKYNMLIDFENIYNTKNFNVLNNPKNYYDVYDKFYISNFFNVIVKNDNSEKYINIFDKRYSGFWTNVNKDGKVYYKGILYDLNNIYKNNSLIDDSLKIDKFAVFVEPHFTYQDIQEYNSLYKYTKVLSNISYEDSYRYLYSDFYDYYNNFSQEVKNNVLVKKAEPGIDDNDPSKKYYYDLYDIYTKINTEQENKYLYDINLYYDLNDIYILMYHYLNSANLHDDQKNIEEYINFESLDVKHDYKIIECYNIKNIYSENFQSEENNYSNLIYRENKFLEYDNIYWAKDRIYFSIYPNNTKYSLLEQYSLFEENKDSNIILYFKSDFIKVEEIESYLDSLSIYTDLDNNRIFSDISNFKNLDKYYYINGLYNKKDKKTYTSPVFKQLTGLDDNYGKIYSGKNDDNVIFIDPYNLKNVYNYILSESLDDESFNEKFESSIKYCRFLNNNHVYYYINKLYKDHENLNDLNENNECLYNKEEIDFVNESEESIISRTIYIRIRNFINISIGEKIYSTIILRDEYIPIKKLGFKDVGELLNSSEYNEEFKCWKFNNIVCYKDKQISSFELFFKKKMYKLNKDLYNLILSLNDVDSYKDLYLYHLYTQENYNLNFYYNIENVETLSNIDILKSNLNESLYPYFNSIWEENRSLTKIYSDYFINNISEAIYTINDVEYSYYRYNEPPLNMLVYSKGELEGLDKYIIVNGEKDNFACKELVDKFGCTEKQLNLYDNLCTYTYNGINYGFYYINTYFSNTSTYLNLINEEMNPIDYVNYINDIDISLLNEYSYSYLIPTYKNILPYMNNNNITKFLINNSNILIKPISNKLDNIYKQYPNFDKETLISYTIYNTKKHKSLELTRYFDNIVPYIHKESSVTSYYLYFKKTNKYIENSKILNNEPYIMHEESSSIYKYVPVSYFYTYMDNNVEIIGEKTFTPTEYKYYNFNMYYNIEKYFEIEVLDENKELRKFNEKEMIKFENNQEEILRLFTNYIKKYEDLTESDILFLYKKYKVDFNHNFIGLEKETYNRLYQIKIEFSLL